MNDRGVRVESLCENERVSESGERHESESDSERVSDRGVRVESLCESERVSESEIGRAHV